MTADIRRQIRDAVRLAVAYWPNSHLGDYSPREDIRSAFRIMRMRTERGESIQAAAGYIETDAYRHADM